MLTRQSTRYVLLASESGNTHYKAAAVKSSSKLCRCAKSTQEKSWPLSTRTESALAAEYFCFRTKTVGWIRHQCSPIHGERFDGFPLTPSCFVVYVYLGVSQQYTFSAARDCLGSRQTRWFPYGESKSEVLSSADLSANAEPIGDDSKARTNSKRAETRNHHLRNLLCHTNNMEA